MLQLNENKQFAFSKDWHFRCVLFTDSGVLNICHCSPGCSAQPVLRDYLTLHVRDMANESGKNYCF